MQARFHEPRDAGNHPVSAPIVKDVGFATHFAPAHIGAFYPKLIEYLEREMGADFEALPCFEGGVEALDGRFRVVIFGTRRAAVKMASRCSFTKSLLIDHGPIHTNRAPHGKVHFEIFSSEYLRATYSNLGIRPLLKGWSGSYFISSDTDCRHPLPGECLVYLIPSRGWKANSLVEVPFSEEQTIEYVTSLCGIFRRVHVVSHLSSAVNFMAKYSYRLPTNAVPVNHGPEFMRLINNVEAVFFEYSSVVATALWNPEVRLFVRMPKYPCGPATLHAKWFHELLDEVAYPVCNDDFSKVLTQIRVDPKRGAREAAKWQIYDATVEDPYAAVLECVREAVLISKSEPGSGK